MLSLNPLYREALESALKRCHLVPSGWQGPSTAIVYSSMTVPQEVEPGLL